MASVDLNLSSSPTQTSLQRLRLFSVCLVLFSRNSTPVLSFRAVFFPIFNEAGRLRLTEYLPSLPQDDCRLFGFVRITTGDAMSKRAKFTLITWIGENVSGLQRAKISTDKALVKEIVQVGDVCVGTGEPTGVKL